MSKALLGVQLPRTELALLDEIRRLRARVAHLEAELAAACPDQDLPTAVSDRSAREPAPAPTVR
ncbi:MAG: hypothetical protein ACLFS9_06845 [Nitriliruptoraceae bacterium]